MQWSYAGIFENVLVDESEGWRPNRNDGKSLARGLRQSDRRFARPGHGDGGLPPKVLKPVIAHRVDIKRIKSLIRCRQSRGDVSPRSLFSCGRVPRKNDAGNIDQLRRKSVARGFHYGAGRCDRIDIRISRSQYGNILGHFLSIFVVHEFYICGHPMSCVDGSRLYPRA